MESLPSSVADLPLDWQEIFRRMPPIVGYSDICMAFGIENSKSALNSDPDAPPPIYFGRQARFIRSEIVLWAFNRAKNAKLCGRPAKVWE